MTLHVGQHCKRADFDEAKCSIHVSEGRPFAAIGFGQLVLYSGEDVSPVEFALELRRLASEVEHKYAGFLRKRRAAEEAAS